ncbi:N-acetyltransferase family protein [Pseudoroseicyclus sp. CXY001]|uniref:GNAT family N-acetyltransferase n=1 Tax=Pseudoroseicyclus sp. CXY001 TaxID=3242492 RepID=UPI003570F059
MSDRQERGEMPEHDVTIRRGRPDEAAALARLHVDVWRATYGGLAPEEALSRLDEARRMPYWSGALATVQPARGVWVAEEAGKLLGVVSLGAATHPTFAGRAEIKHLYVAAEAQGRGLGKRLLQAALEDCRSAGEHGAALAVVRQNARARAFYRAMGGVEGAGFLDPGPLWRSENIVVTWEFG